MAAISPLTSMNARRSPRPRSSSRARSIPGELRSRRCGHPMPVKPPDPHQRLDRDVEGAPGGALEGTGPRQDQAEVLVHAHPFPARAAVQLAQVARLVEQREPALDPSQLGEGRRTRVEPFLLRCREDDHVDRLPHHPRPALDERVVRAPLRQAGDEHGPEAGADGSDEPAPVHDPSSARLKPRLGVCP